MRNIIAIVFVTASLCQGLTFYVSPDGKVTNWGAEAFPWPDVDTAVARVPDGGGHLIIVKEGVYPPFTVTRGGVSKAGGYLVIRSAEKWKARIAATKTNAVTVKAPYVSIEGFDVSGASCNGVKIEADSVTVRSCWIHENATGVYAPNRQQVVIDSCYLDQNNDGIYASGTRIIASANICWNNQRYGINFYPVAHDSSAYNNIIGTNRVAGIRFADGQDNNIIHNTVYQASTGMLLGPRVQAVVGNNLIAECDTPLMKPFVPGSSFIRNVIDRYENMAGDVMINPNSLFVHPGDLPLALRLGSPAIGAGDPNLSPVTDLLGRYIRKTRVDCGAVQYNPRLEGGCPCQ
jgi:hypothetical protein